MTDDLKLSEGLKKAELTTQKEKSLKNILKQRQ